jgi:hypothetical protein
VESSLKLRKNSQISCYILGHIPSKGITVGNDIDISETQPALIISGPNAGGKTVTLKVVNTRTRIHYVIQISFYKGFLRASLTDCGLAGADGAALHPAPGGPRGQGGRLLRGRGGHRRPAVGDWRSVHILGSFECVQDCAGGSGEQCLGACLGACCVRPSRRVSRSPSSCPFEGRDSCYLQR